MSYLSNIPQILQAVKESGARTILDIGPGFGKYGLLIREQYLSDKAAAGELTPVDDLNIDCIETTKYFLDNKRLLSLYRSVTEGDFRDLSPLNYDLILLIDVIEHYPKEEILKWLHNNKGPYLISTPKDTTMYTQHFYGDPHVHQTQWDKSDFLEFSIKDYSTSDSHILLIK